MGLFRLSILCAKYEFDGLVFLGFCLIGLKIQKVILFEVQWSQNENGK
jgi:hypothetical protein